MKKTLMLMAALIFAVVSVYAQDAGVQTALEQVELKLKNARVHNAAEIAEIKNHLRIALKNASNVDADAISEAAIECKKYGLATAEAAKIAVAAANASEEATLQTRTQNRAMIRECLKEGCDAEGLKAALQAVRSAIASGYSPKESRGMVSATVLEGLKDGLRGKELAAKIHEKLAVTTQRQRARESEMRQEKTRQRVERREGRREQIKSGQTTLQGSGQQGMGDDWKPKR